jgi:hypothetical protein
MVDDPTDLEREKTLRKLAARLFFNVEKRGSRFTITRYVDVPAPVGHENLTLAEVEEVLNTWKLRGLHGG